MISVEEHRARILDTAPLLPSVRVPLPLALGAVLAEDVISRWPVPLFDNSAMDGYAVRSVDAAEGAELRIVADIPAGSSADPSLRPGEAARIMTGAPVPTDADAIVPLEHTDLGTVRRMDPPEQITVLTAARPGAHIRRAGEDAPAGTRAVAAGTELTAWQLSAIASAGHDTVLVRRAPRVAVISTGSELIPPSETPLPGQIPESNSTLIGAAVRAAGAELVSVRTVPDDAEQLREALGEIDADAVVLSGGASVGAFDIVRAVLEEDHDVLFQNVAMQPGKPQGFGVLRSGALAFCLPGNPVGAAASFEMFVRPALRKMAGHTVIDRSLVIRRASSGWASPPGRLQLVPVVFDDETVRPASGRGSGSHLVASLAAASGFALVDTHVKRVHEGDDLAVMVVS